MRSVYALIPAALLAGTILGAPAEAKRAEDPGVHAERISAHKKYYKIAGVKNPGKIRKVASRKTRKVASAKTRKVASVKAPKMASTKTVKIANAKTGKVRIAKTVKIANAETGKVASAKTLKIMRARISKVAGAKMRKIAAFNTTSATKTLRSGPRPMAHLIPSEKMNMSDQALAISGANDMRVAAIIREMAPSYGVPTWFALRIANVESGFNPYARGRAGEIGVYQLKCQTARGMGFSGDCEALTDARTNVQWGLKHLSLAIASSGGNLRLAASKHNGGLGRKSLVLSYIAKVF
jgi:soluble lytic murein transglycosylase-like protein